MHTEIEAKLKVNSLQATEERLTSLGAAFQRRTVQTDYYFDTADRVMTRSDECLRLRVEREGENETLVLTYKGAKEKGDFKRRVEVNLEVGDAGAAADLLGALGYRKALVFNKRRRTWRLDECEVALDELPLIGAFVEIEGPGSERIAHVQDALGLAAVPHVPDSYASLIAARMSELGLTRTEIFL